MEYNKYGGRRKWPKKNTSRFCYPRSSRDCLKHRSPTIDANNFKLKPTLILMVRQSQFRRTPSEDPNLHLSIYLEVCDTLKLNGVSTDVIHLRLFPFSLRDKERLGYITFHLDALPLGTSLEEPSLLSFSLRAKQQAWEIRSPSSHKKIRCSTKAGSSLKICCAYAPIIVFSVGWLSKPFIMVWLNL